MGDCAAARRLSALKRHCSWCVVDQLLSKFVKLKKGPWEEGFLVQASPTDGCRSVDLWLAQPHVREMIWGGWIYRGSLLKLNKPSSLNDLFDIGFFICSVIESSRFLDVLTLEDWYDY